MDTKKLLDFLDNFIAIFRHYGSEFKSKYKNDAEQWHKALCKLFCQLIRPSDLPSRMNIDGLDDFTVFQDQFCTKVLQHQISQQLSGKSASSVTEETVSCRNCKLPHNVLDCKTNCTYSFCANSSPHQAKDCVNWKSTKSKNPLSLSPSPPSKYPAIQVAPAIQTVPSPIPPVDTEVIFDSGSGVTTIPTSNFLTRNSSVQLPPLNAITADGSLHSSTRSDRFQGYLLTSCPLFTTFNLFVGLPSSRSHCYCGFNFDANFYQEQFN
jgi:hypothetical protein